MLGSAHVHAQSSSTEPHLVCMQAASPSSCSGVASGTRPVAVMCRSCGRMAEVSVARHNTHSMHSQQTHPGPAQLGTVQQQAGQVLVEGALRAKCTAASRKEERGGVLCRQQRPGPVDVRGEEASSPRALCHANGVRAVGALRLKVVKDGRQPHPAIARAARHLAFLAQHVGRCPWHQQQPNARRARDGLLTQAQQHHEAVVHATSVGSSAHVQVHLVHLDVDAVPDICKVAVLPSLPQLLHRGALNGQAAQLRREQPRAVLQQQKQQREQASRRAAGWLACWQSGANTHAPRARRCPPSRTAWPPSPSRTAARAASRKSPRHTTWACIGWAGAELSGDAGRAARMLRQLKRTERQGETLRTAPAERH